ncbi:MAG: AmmeMemoRadiSam system protein B [Candidatus Berkelbacteria bacterium]
MKKFILIVISLLSIAGSYYFFFMNKVLAPGGGSTAARGQNIPVVIVPHFNDFAVKRAELLKQAGASYKPETAIVVSVNHYNSGSSDITTAERTWTLSGGNVSSNSSLVKKLAESGIALSDENAFASEHGITNVLPDVRDNISANILPIIIKDTTSKDQVNKLEAWIDSNCKDCMVIASVDFSHYQPSAIAKVHDQFSIQALQSMNADKIWLAETDSPQTLYLAEKVAAKNNAKNFNLFYNSNSGEVGKNDDAETTSVVLGYYSDKASVAGAEASTSFVIAGDAMFDRNVWQRYNPDLKKVFDNFGTRVFRGSDISLINLEGPVSSVSHEGIKTGGMSFNFQPQVPSVLKYLNITQVSLANNHTNNAGSSGFTTTKSMLEKSGIKYFGLPSGYSEASVLRIPGELPVSIIGIMTLDSFDETALEAKIKSEKSAGQAVILMPHWGTEYAPKHSTSQGQMAKDWISAGADMIVGSHPHVTEDFEVVNGKPVVYSLGNFVFDQFFSQETQEGLVLAGTITKDKITLSFLPTVEKLVKPEFMTGADKTAKIKTIIDLSLATGFKKLTSDTIEIAR